MKILVTDFDKTIYTEYFIENIKRVKRFVEKGNLFIIATGRPLFSLLKTIKGIEIPYDYLICDDGGVIYNKKLETIYRKDINEEDTIKIIEKLNQNKIFTEVACNDTKQYVSFPIKNANTINAIYSEEEKANKALQIIEEEHPNIKGYLSEVHLNINEKTVTKGNAVKIIIEKLNISKEDVYTIGDRINDVSMNQYFESFAIKTGDEELKQCSTHIVSSFIEMMDKIDPIK